MDLHEEGDLATCCAFGLPTREALDIQVAEAILPARPGVYHRDIMENILPSRPAQVMDFGVYRRSCASRRRGTLPASNQPHSTTSGTSSVRLGPAPPGPAATPDRHLSGGRHQLIRRAIDQ